VGIGGAVRCGSTPKQSAYADRTCIPRTPSLERAPPIEGKRPAKAGYHAARCGRIPSRGDTALALTERLPVGAVVLAAGAATRYGSPKQRLLLAEVLDRLSASTEIGEVVVVTGAYDVDTDAQVVACPDWERGPGASLRCGLAALLPETAAAAVILADGPDLSAAAVDRVVAAWRAGAGDVVAASYGGSRGHPVVLGRSVWGSVPDEGARALQPELVPCDDLGPPGDVDRPEDLPSRLR
jgi:CTP:molybdopterin cytidylyltransferase MocA